MGDESHHDVTGFEALSIVRMSHAREVGINDDWIVVLAIFYLYNGCISGCIGYPPGKDETSPTKPEKGQQPSTKKSDSWQVICDRSMEGSLVVWLVVSNIFYFHPYLGRRDDPI